MSYYLQKIKELVLISGGIEYLKQKYFFQKYIFYIYIIKLLFLLFVFNVKIFITVTKYDENDTL